MDDKSQIKATIDRFYELISGTRQEARDWEAFRNLFAAGAQFWILSQSTEGGPTVSILDLDTYIERLSAGLAQADFYEQATIVEIHISQNIAAAITTYAARRAPGEEQPFKEGTCYVHLIQQNGDWRICAMIYQDERE